VTSSALTSPLLMKPASASAVILVKSRLTVLYPTSLFRTSLMLPRPVALAAP
jgi:hypothetical protein